jgi:outer membrane protein assembly factor BamA
MTQARPILVFLLLILVSLSAIAQQPSFPIERIEVRGARFASEEVVARESLIVEGMTYTEAQLRAAMSRINRLPFVLDSSFALEKGTTHGAYVLVITIVETKPVFIEAISETQRQGGSSFTGEVFRSGVRLFVGSSSLIHAATDFEGNYQAGLTQYNLFGRPGYVSLGVRWTDHNRGSFESPLPERSLFEYQVDPSPELRFGFPVSGDHSIVGSWQHDSSSQSMTTETGSRNEKRTFDRGELAWVFDTTDDPILPTSGTLWRSGMNVGLSRNESTGSNSFGDSEVRSGSVFSSWERHLPLNGWVSVNYGLGAGIGRSEWETEGRTVFPDETEVPVRFTSAVDSISYTASAGLSSSLWSDRLTRKFGDLRFETKAKYLGADQSSDEILIYGSDHATLDAAIVQRSVWGTLRLAFSYAREID